MSYIATKEKWLETILSHVAFDGWDKKALANAAAELDAPIEEAELYFPRGALDALLFWLDQTNESVTKKLPKIDGFEDMKHHEKVAAAIMLRFELSQPHKAAVRKALAFLSRPRFIFYAPRTTYATVDTIWRALGDDSTDFNFYTKRALLAKVYGTTLLHWLRDDSEDMTSTRAFLMRRLKGVLKVGKTIGTVKETVNRYAPGDGDLARH